MIPNNTNEKVYKIEKINYSKIPDFDIKKINYDYFEIISDRVIRTKILINLKTDEDIKRLSLYLDKIGINNKLKEMNVRFDYFN